MGGLFSNISRGLPNIYIDFNNVEPQSEDEATLYTGFQEVLSSANEYIEKFSNYQDSSNLIAQALINSAPEVVTPAWNSVFPSIRFIRTLHEYTEQLVQQFLIILDYVFHVLDGNQITILDKYPAATKSFAQCLDIFMRLDEIKLSLPKLNSDLSFFRRTATHIDNSDEIGELFAKSTDLSLFYGAPTPFLSSAITAVQNKYKTPQEASSISYIFSSIVDVCTSILTNHKFDNEETNLLCLRCIVGSILIFDHISSKNPFSSKSPMKIVAACQLVANYDPPKPELINALKFSSKKLNDPTTTNSIHDLIH